MIILGTNSIKDTGYDVANSVRFDTNAYMHKTPSGAGSLTTWTFSTWIKRSKLGASQYILDAVQSDANYQTFIYFNSDDTIIFFDINNDSDQGKLITNRKFRDVGAWYNLTFIWNTTSGTAGDRIQLWVNGVRETSFATQTNPDQNDSSTLGGAFLTEIGRSPGGGGENYLNGYMAETVYQNGSATTPVDKFGEFDSDSGIWKPKDVSGLTAGTNGFYLDFEDSSNLGNDVFGGTDLTEVNLAAIDQSTDTCTNNFATGNPLDNGCGKAPTFSEGNLKYVSASTFNFALPTIGVSSGKWYMEIKFVALGEGGSIMAGITDQFDNTNRDLTGNAFAGGEPLGIGYYQNGNKYLNNVASSYGSTYTTGDIIGVYLDVDNSKLYFAKNGTLQNSGTGLDLPSSANSTGVFFFMPSVDKATIEVNYGNPTFTGTDKADANGYGSFEYDPSVGTFDGASKDFYALNTKNLAEYG